MREKGREVPGLFISDEKDVLYSRPWTGFVNKLFLLVDGIIKCDPV